MPVRRIADEPAFVLHSYDWSESSLILEVFCRRQGPGNARSTASAGMACSAAF